MLAGFACNHAIPFLVNVRSGADHGEGKAHIVAVVET
jgi:hypothetical protein